MKAKSRVVRVVQVRRWWQVEVKLWTRHKSRCVQLYLLVFVRRFQWPLILPDVGKILPLKDTRKICIPILINIPPSRPDPARYNAGPCSASASACARKRTCSFSIDSAFCTHELWLEQRSGCTYTLTVNHHGLRFRHRHERTGFICPSVAN